LRPRASSIQAPPRLPSRVQVDVELGEQRALGRHHAEEAHVLVPGLRVSGWMRTENSFSATPNSPSSTFGSWKYCFTSSSENE
jgi:hypothetical protein